VPSNWELEGFGDYQYGGDHLREPNKFPKEQGKVSFVVSTVRSVGMIEL
jgi:hypothetical protein